MTSWDDIATAVLHDLAAIQAEYTKAFIERATRKMEVMISKQYSGTSTRRSAAPQIIRLRDGGWTMKEIALTLHLSYGRVQTVCQEERFRRDYAVTLANQWRSR